MIFEICVDSVEGVLAAQAAGAQRVELCDNLVEGGTTPSLGMLKVARQAVSIEINHMIRPRGGDFCYTRYEFAVMCHDIEAAKQAGANGVVIGLLLPDGQIDVERTRFLVDLARPLNVTFHRAFDVCQNPQQALEELISLGVQRVLTSGQRPNALLGAPLLADLVRQAGERIIIMPGGDVDEHNIAEILAVSGAREVHFAARRNQASPMTYRNPSVYMGVPDVDEYIYKVTDEDWVRRILQAAGSF